MIDFSIFGSAIDLLMSTPSSWLVILPGLIVGLLFGAIPGLSVSIAMAVCLPFTFYMDFLSSLLFLTAIFTGSGFAGAIPAILINVPGTPAAVATAFDGYPMCRQGRHNQALGVALGASTFSCVLGYVSLLLLVKPISELVLMLGPVEMFLVIVWGLSLIAMLSAGSALKALIAGLFGMLLGTIGMSARGDLRGTFDTYWLLEGIPIVPAILGLFAVSELLNLIGIKFIVDDKDARKVEFKLILRGFASVFHYPTTLLRGSAFGVIVGALPGVGSSVANLVSYSDAKRRASDPSSFGKGDSRGVIASEAANSCSEAGSLITLLALGIPGGGATAVMLGVLSMHGVTGGPRFINENMDTVYALILGNFAQCFLLVAIGLPFIYFAAFIIRLPARYLIPLVLSVCIAGTYSMEGSLIGPVTVLVFGIMGWILRQFGYPVAAVGVGLLLGSLADAELLRSYQIVGGDLSYLLSRPIALGLLVLLVLSSLLPFVRRRKLFSGAEDTSG